MSQAKCSAILGQMFGEEYLVSLQAPYREASWTSDAHSIRPSLNHMATSGKNHHMTAVTKTEPMHITLDKLTISLFSST